MTWIPDLFAAFAQVLGKRRLQSPQLVASHVLAVGCTRFQSRML